MSLAGILEGVGGRGVMKERGVLGGSRFGTTLFHASAKALSAGDASETSVENGLAPALVAAAAAGEKVDRERKREAA